MKRETIYASLVGCAFFFLIAYVSYWYFSPAERTGNSTMEGEPASRKAVGAIPAAGKEPAPFTEKSSSPDNATPAAAEPLGTTPAAPASNAAGRSTVETDTLENEGTRQKFGVRGKAAQMRNEGKGVQREGRRKRGPAEDD
jgi:hypothetical protein